MAMQSGIGFSKIVILVGAGYTSTILLKNGKLSDVLGELQSLLKGLEKNGESSQADGDHSDAIASQVRRLAMEVRQLASARQITVLNGSSGQLGNITNLIVPATALGALGYGYMWWKGLSFSDLMYVTKRNMANAVSNLTKHLEHVSEALAATKRHLTQRIENLDGKMDQQVELSKLIKNEVTDVRADLSQVGYDLDSLQRMVSGLELLKFALCWVFGGEGEFYSDDSTGSNTLIMQCLGESLSLKLEKYRPQNLDIDPSPPQTS
ncbi:GRIP/coiled-coil protein, putative [Actinidia rufa]|uniref:GRIP/coiled-coil protein, putative n=1 Tax=Actinidia rufa TaxID=165716 RepID=A0A7J0FNZ6_9ERIC|nr:GRIP/coiled-coil protein, putative [Actinidia rufa]